MEFTTQILHLLALAVAPGIFFLWLFWVRDKYEREPARLLLATFFLGALYILPTLILENLGSIIVPGPEEGANIIHVVAYYFVVIAFVEESMKLLAVRVKAYRSREFNEVMDGIVYSCAAALGFATVENILYVTQRGIEVGVLRAVLSVPGHALDSGMFGFFLGLAKFRERGGSGITFSGLLLATVFHGLWDTFLALDLFLMALPIYGLQWIIVAAMMRKALSLSPFKQRAIPLIIPIVTQKLGGACPTCSNPLTYRHQSLRWYCPTCKRYVDRPVVMGVPQPGMFGGAKTHHPPPLQIGPKPRPAAKYCINCGSAIPEDSKYCQRCGARQT
ncbi:MAG: PrsW family glutamic-type intramembrane protease [Candidatus Bathyarchaeia archaeon]|nr:PrsW family intramembrane metalloprotease [Candidatus Bathyarchaeota archaeon]